MYHDNADIQQAQVRLCDALCEWERATGCRSLLVMVTAGYGYDFVAIDGRPVPASSDYRRKLVGPVWEAAREHLDTFDDEEKRFPLQGLGSVPWSLAEVAYESYRKFFSSSQTLERIAERGGFGVEEFCLLFLGLNPVGRNQRATVNVVAVVSAFLGARLETTYGDAALKRMGSP